MSISVYVLVVSILRSLIFSTYSVSRTASSSLPFARSCRWRPSSSSFFPSYLFQGRAKCPCAGASRASNCFSAVSLEVHFLQRFDRFYPSCIRIPRCFVLSRLVVRTRYPLPVCTCLIVSNESSTYGGCLADPRSLLNLVIKSVILLHSVNHNVVLL